jgi:microcystin-dependent protein
MFDTPLLGFVVPFAGKTPPRKWMFCQGQELPISEYDSLFSLIGTMYGGDGINTFALPNLCGRVAVHPGPGPQMQQNYTPGQTGGYEKVSLTIDNLPPHNHQLIGEITAAPFCSIEPGNASSTDIPGNHYPKLSSKGFLYSDAPDESIRMGQTAISAPIQPDPNEPKDAKEQVDIMSPFLVMNYIICIDGIWPTPDYPQ